MRRNSISPQNLNSGPVEGFDYGENGYGPEGSNVGFNETAGQFQIEIKGLIEPKSDAAKRVCQENLNEVITAFVQDKTSLERGLFDELVAEELTQVRMGKIIKDKYLELDEGDQEAVRQHAIAALNLTQQAKATQGEDGEASANTAFVDGVRKFAMDVQDLDIDLIDKINPFSEAYAIFAKPMDENSLKQLKAVINSKKIQLSEEEARELAKRAIQLKQERGRLPQITSNDLGSGEWLKGLLSYREKWRRNRMTEKTNKELLEQLGVEAKTDKKATLTPKEERIIAGFEAIQQFVEAQGHVPEHGEEKDIFQRLYAVRLDRIAAQTECRDLISDLDHQMLLTVAGKIAEPVGEYDADADILAALGLAAPKQSDVTFLQQVKPRAAMRAVEEVASRKACEDFAAFESLFKQVKTELKQGVRKTIRFGQGNFFIVDGLTAYVAEIGETFKAPNGENDARLRVIFSNATESDLLMRSLQRALYKDAARRRISAMDYGPLFADEVEDDDLASGTIYVLRSFSDHPTIAQSRDVIHKIGVTDGKVEKRIGNARYDPTYLMADVEVVATYELYNINRSKLGHLLHCFFEPTRLEIEIADRFGKPVMPQEWFLVPVFVIDKVVEKIVDGTIRSYQYDFESAKLIEVTA